MCSTIYLELCGNVKKLIEALYLQLQQTLSEKEQLEDKLGQLSLDSVCARSVIDHEFSGDTTGNFIGSVEYQLSLTLKKHCNQL